MSTLKESLQLLLAAPVQQHAAVDGLHVTVYPGGVVNIDRREGDLQRADVDHLRAALTELGYEELESWMPRQGMSWLSDGVGAGVSFRVKLTG